MNILQFLSMSLPHNLIMYYDDGGEIYYDDINTVYHDHGFDDTHDYIPLARPISDINKEIEHMGEKFIPSERLKKYSIDNFGNDIKLNFMSRTTEDHWPLWVIQKLIEWHFAIGLSEKEYINVNTLLENPYK